jgi:hypothetical protein
MVPGWWRAYAALVSAACGLPGTPTPQGLYRIYPGEYGAEGELEIRQVFEPEE